MSSIHLSEGELNYLKGLRCLGNASASELRKLFKRTWEHQNPQHHWQDDAQSGIMFHNKHKPPSAYPIYDDKIKEGDTAQWDMTVLNRVFAQYPNFADDAMRNNVKKLKDLRNEYSHLQQTTRSTADFQKDIQKVRDVFQQLSLDERVLNDALSVPDDHALLREEMTRLRTELLSEVQQIHSRFDSMQSQLAALGPSENIPDTDGPDGINENGGNQTDPTLPDWFQNIDAESRKRKMNEGELMKMVNYIANGWEFVAIQLGLKKTIIEKCKSSQNTPDLQMIDAFMKWVQKASRGATREAFIRALYACNDQCTIDWDGIEEEFETL